MVCSPGELSHSCPQLLHGESCQCSEVQLVEECTCVRDALEGSAADVLWELGTDATFTVILETLKKHFGNANRAEGNRALLSTHVVNQVSLFRRCMQIFVGYFH